MLRGVGISAQTAQQQHEDPSGLSPRTRAIVKPELVANARFRVYDKDGDGTMDAEEVFLSRSVPFFLPPAPF